MNTYDSEDIVNIGWGEDLTIRELAETVAAVVGRYPAKGLRRLGARTVA
jgi:nucleoside-diphosphate-sugar epimerase